MPQRKPTGRVLGSRIEIDEAPPTPGEIFEERIADHPAKNAIITALVRLRFAGLDVTDATVQQQAIEVGERKYREAKAREAAGQQHAERYKLDHDPDDRAGVHVVYYARLGDLVKIGTSANVARRLATLNTQGVMALEFGDRTLERQRHKEFVESHQHGEWFRLDETLGRHIADVRAKFEAQVGMSTEEWLVARRAAA